MRETAAQALAEVVRAMPEAAARATTEALVALCGDESPAWQASGGGGGGRVLGIATVA